MDKIFNVSSILEHIDNMNSFIELITEKKKGKFLKINSLKFSYSSIRRLTPKFIASNFNKDTNELSFSYDLIMELKEKNNTTLYDRIIIRYSDIVPSITRRIGNRVRVFYDIRKNGKEYDHQYMTWIALNNVLSRNIKLSFDDNDTPMRYTTLDPVICHSLTSNFEFHNIGSLRHMVTEVNPYRKTVELSEGSTFITSAVPVEPTGSVFGIINDTLTIDRYFVKLQNITNIKMITSSFLDYMTSGKIIVVIELTGNRKIIFHCRYNASFVSIDDHTTVTPIPMFVFKNYYETLENYFNSLKTKVEDIKKHFATSDIVTSSSIKEDDTSVENLYPKSDVKGK